MLDIELVRKNPEIVKNSLARRGFAFDADAFARADALWRESKRRYDETQAARNRVAAAIPKAKKAGEDVAELLREGEAAKRLSDEIRAEMDERDAALRGMLAAVPNMLLPFVPDGADEKENVVLRQVGEPTGFDFEPKTHDEIGAILGGLDFDAGARLSGARFSVAKGGVARLHRALIQMMLDTHVDQNGYTEVQTPYLVSAKTLYGTGQLPKFEEDLFRLERDGLYLIPTAEVPVTNLLAGAGLTEAELPVAMVCHTPCFRREAGSAGRDVKGLIRQHQFEKVELVRACRPEDVETEFEKLLDDAESILRRLELPYRAVALCAGDTGFSAERTVDLEVWLPGQNAWREISSVSSFGTFQARRMGASFKGADGKNRLMATLNGSGLAAGRALVAVLENYQNPDMSVTVPEALRPYMNGVERIYPVADAKPVRKPSA